MTDRYYNALQVMEQIARPAIDAAYEREMDHLKGQKSLTRQDVRSAMGVAYMATIRALAASAARGAAAAIAANDQTTRAEIAQQIAADPALAPVLGGKGAA